MEEDIDIIGNHGEENVSENTTGGGHFNNLQLSFTSHEKDGSLHALQTAYGELKKRLQEQVSKNVVLQTSIREMEMQRISSGRPNSGVFGAAGPPSEPEQDLQAQYRAEFGFAQSLERQVIRAKSTLSKLESENKHLMKKLSQVEDELKQNRIRENERVKEIEKLRAEVQDKGTMALSKEVEALKLQLQKRDEEIFRLKNSVQKQDQDVLQFQLQEKDKVRGLETGVRGLETGMYSQNPPNSISLEEERRILDQVERYSKIIKTLKAQVQDQGKMLLKQQEAIRKLIDQPKSTSLTSSMSRYAAEGASLVQPHSESQPSPSPAHLQSHSVDVYAQKKQPPLVSGFPTLQTMAPDESSHELGEQFQLLNFGKQDTTFSRGAKESEFLGVESGYSDKISPLIQGSIKRDNKKKHSTAASQPLRQGVEETYPLATKASDATVKITSPTQDLSVYENYDVLTEIGNSERSGVPDNRKSYDIPGSSTRPYNPEVSDYVNLKDVHPSRAGGNIPVISPRVMVVPPDEQMNKSPPYRQAQEHASGGVSPPHPVVRSPSSQGRSEEREGRNKPYTQPSIGRVPQENAIKQDIRVVAPSGGGTRPKQVVQKTPLGNSQICPVCGQNFVNISMENFQMHVFHCMDDNSEECMTLRNTSPPPAPAAAKDVRICPMCDASYPSELQSEFERHVQEHFGEDPIGDRFEVLRP